MGTSAAPTGRGALEEMGTYPRHVLYFSSTFYLRQLNLFPNNQSFEPSYFDPIQKFGMSTRGLTLIFDQVPSTFFRPPFGVEDKPSEDVFAKVVSVAEEAGVSKIKMMSVSAIVL